MDSSIENIILFGDKKDDAILNLMRTGLSERFKLYLYGEDLVSSIGQGRTLLVADRQHIKKIALNRFVLLLKEHAGLERFFDITETSSPIAIANSQNSRQLNDLSKRGIPFISCGMLSKDTLTYSSCTDDSVVISLQRSIQTLSGQQVEPMEMPLLLPQCDGGYSLLAYAALCILLDDIQSLLKLGNYYK